MLTDLLSFPKVELMSKKTFFILFLFIGILLLLIFVFFWIRGRSKVPGERPVTGVLSLENSYLFASPLLAKTGGEKITIFAFVLSDQGLGIPDKKVILYSAPPLAAQVVREKTDPRGLASFELTSESPGEFRIWANVTGEGQIKQTVLVTYED